MPENIEKEKLDEEKLIEEDVENVIDKGRVINFSDAVFAFAATLLVLKIDLPQINPGFVENQLAQSLINLWPQYFANIIAFLAIGYYWLTHHQIFGNLTRLDRGIVWLNIIFLITLSFLPFPVDIYGDYPTVPIVVVFYSASLALTGYMLALLWWYASSNHKLISKKMTNRKIHFYTSKFLIAPIVFTISIPLVYIHPLLTQASWVLIIISAIFINRKYKYKGVMDDSSI